MTGFAMRTDPTTSPRAEVTDEDVRETKAREQALWFLKHYSAKMTAEELVQGMFEAPAMQDLIADRARHGSTPQRLSEAGKALLLELRDGLLDDAELASSVSESVEYMNKAKQLEAIIAAQDAQAGGGERVRHLKGGGIYDVLHRAGDVQMSTRPLQEGDKIVTYRDVKTGHWFHRRLEEFDDGRFETLLGMRDGSGDGPRVPTFRGPATPKQAEGGPTVDRQAVSAERLEGLRTDALMILQHAPRRADDRRACSLTPKELLALIDHPASDEVRRLREALGRIKEVGTRSFMERTGDAYAGDGHREITVVSDEAEIAAAALREPQS